MTPMTTKAQQLPTMGANVAFAILSTHKHPHRLTPHTRTQAMVPEIVQLFIHFLWVERQRKIRGRPTKTLHTLIWFMDCGWMWAAWLLFTSHHVAAATLLTLTFRILRGHSQGSAHCAPVTIMSSPGSWCCYSVESFTALQLTVQQLNSMLLSFHRQFWYFPMV